MFAQKNKLFIIKSFFFSLILFLSCENYNVKTYEIGHVKTIYGDMYFWLYEETPLHKASFVALSNNNYWDSLSFNRVIENFVIQGGCPDVPEGFSNSPYLIEPEFIPEIKHLFGAVGMGRDNNPEKRSAGCQFYIVHDTLGIPRLDQNYTVFGQLFNGFEVLNKIATLKTDSLDSPIDRVSIKVSTLRLTKKELTELGGFSFLK
jgi:peptidyl-prolyl cis-trans isomerase B (cyclophilin B)